MSVVEIMTHFGWKFVLGREKTRGPLSRAVLRWQARVVTEIVALAAIGPVPVAAFKKLE